MEKKLGLSYQWNFAFLGHDAPVMAGMWGVKLTRPTVRDLWKQTWANESFHDIIYYDRDNYGADQAFLAWWESLLSNSALFLTKHSYFQNHPQMAWIRLLDNFCYFSGRKHINLTFIYRIWVRQKSSSAYFDLVGTLIECELFYWNRYWRLVWNSIGVS